MKENNCAKAAKLAGLDKAKLKQLSEIAKKASIRGGNILMDHYGKLENIKNKGRIGDLVTDADIACERAVIAYLQKETPEIGILAEETGQSGQENALCWCLDPLDGTTNFAHGYPLFATSIGLTWNSIPCLGSISIPFFKEIFWGAPEIGVYCNNSPIKVSSSDSLINSLLVTGFAYDRCLVKDNNYAEFCALTHRTRGVRRGGAAAVDLAFLACGRLDGYWERGLAKWDLAAGVALVEMAGGRISNYPNGDFELDSGRILASSPGIHKELLQELSKVIPLEGHSYGVPEID